MKAQIHSVMEYMFYGSLMYDVVYTSGRLYTFCSEDLPSTARKFLRSSTKTTLIHDNRGRKYARTLRRYEA